MKAQTSRAAQATRGPAPVIRTIRAPRPVQKIEEFSDESVGEPSSSHSDSEDYVAPVKKVVPRKAVAPTRATKRRTVAQDVSLPSTEKVVASMWEEEDSDEDDAYSTIQLTDSDFMSMPYIGQPNYKDIDVIEYRMPKSENTLSFIKCPHNGCNRVIAGMSERFQDELDNEQRKIKSQKNRGMTVSEYNEFVATTYDRYGNVFSLGGLDRSVIMYDTDTKRDIATHKKQFFEMHGRRMTTDEYNDYERTIIKFSGVYANYVNDTKREYAIHFGRTMSVNDYEDYSGNSGSSIGALSRRLINAYKKGITDEEYNDMVSTFAVGTPLVGPHEIAFYKAYGRQMIRHNIAPPRAGTLGEVASTNTSVLMSECCRINIMQRMVLRDDKPYNDRNIKEEGEAQGNVVRRKLDKPIPYNPFTFNSEMARKQPSAPSRIALPAIRTSSRTMEIADDVNAVVDMYPSMPDTSGFDFELDVYNPFTNTPREMVTHEVYTGIRGMSTFRIAGRSITAR